MGERGLEGRVDVSEAAAEGLRQICPATRRGQGWRLLLQHRESRLYYAGAGGWTGDRLTAVAFAYFEEALRACREEELREVELVFARAAPREEPAIFVG